MRSSIVYILPESEVEKAKKFASSNTKYRYAYLPEVTTLRTNFPYKNMHSYFLIGRVYSAIDKACKTEKIDHD